MGTGFKLTDIKGSKCHHGHVLEWGIQRPSDKRRPGQVHPTVGPIGPQTHLVVISLVSKYIIEIDVLSR